MKLLPSLDLAAIPVSFFDIVDGAVEDRLAIPAVDHNVLRVRHWDVRLVTIHLGAVDGLGMTTLVRGLSFKQLLVLLPLGQVGLDKRQVDAGRFHVSIECLAFDDPKNSFHGCYGLDLAVLGNLDRPVDNLPHRTAQL